MSMITDLVERLREYADNPELDMYCTLSCDGECNKILREAADVIEELSAKIQAANMERSSQYYNGGWISVEDRLPEEGDWYLAVFKEKDTGYITIPRVAGYNGGYNGGKGKNIWQIIDEYGLIQGYRDMLECVAWCELPEPYKPESEDKG